MQVNNKKSTDKEEEVYYEPIHHFLDYDDVIISNEFKKYAADEMPCYYLDGSTAKRPAVYGYIVMKDDEQYWTNALEWNCVKKRKKLTKYIKYQLEKDNCNNAIFLERELFEDGGVFSNPKNYTKLMESLLS